MTVITQVKTDATPTQVEWRSIKWAECYQEVRRLQMRIAKATREGRWRKVKSLQWLLTHSYSAKALAVRRVTENQGKKTPGIDGETWSTPESKSDAITRLRRRGYKPLPLRRVFIPKSNNKVRPLGIPVMLDRAMQALHLLALEPVTETKADGNSYGFRPERSTHDAISHLFVMLSRKGAAEWILEGDIESCFDQISHQWILDHALMDKKILQNWLKSGYKEKGKFFPTNEGTPQGGIISPTLANLVLDGLETLLAEKYGSLRFDGHSHRTRKYQVNFVRYADDFVITANSKELLEEVIKPLVKEFLAVRGLRLSERKTKVTHISEGFDFLGQNVRKYRFGKPNEKLLIKPSKKNVKAFKVKIKEAIKKLRGATQEDVIDKLNPIISGWANYHRFVVAKETFQKVDHYIWHRLWRSWSRRQHSRKSIEWIKNRHYMNIDGRDWTFACASEAKGNIKKLQLAANVPIIRHVKIMSTATRYDPAYEEYFEKRTSAKMMQNYAGNPKLRQLWKRQNGACPICRQVITGVTKWHLHHIVRKTDGGSDDIENLRLLHPVCHRQIHSKAEITVEKLVGS